MTLRFKTSQKKGEREEQNSSRQVSKQDGWRSQPRATSPHLSGSSLGWLLTSRQKIGSNLSQLIESAWNTILKYIWEPLLASSRKCIKIDIRGSHWARRNTLMIQEPMIHCRQHHSYLLKKKKSMLELDQRLTWIIPVRISKCKAAEKYP